MGHWYCQIALDGKYDSYGMVSVELKHNAHDLNLDLVWFVEILQIRMDLYFDRESEFESIFDLLPAPLEKGQSFYADFLDHYNLSTPERLTLLLALIPHIQSRLLDVLFTRNATYDKDFAEFGGLKGRNHKGFLPTGETLVFLLAGDNLEASFSVSQLFESDHLFAQHDILKLEAVPDGEPLISGALKISQDVIDYLTRGTNRKPISGKNFPAREITTTLDWDDLVLNPATHQQIDEIRTWMQYGETLMNDWGLGNKLRPGYRCLFYGPPGTGKSMTACLMGKSMNRPVYRIDLSMVVSKYIGETEKNLSKIFDQAENKNWILFFDEADALFGKRTGVSDSHDRYANQEVSFLLQRIEIFNGIVVLASNMKGNLDDAFTRRFESIIHFPAPGEEERLQLWQKSFSKSCQLEDGIELNDIANQYQLSGGSTMNVVRYSSLMALKRNSNTITLSDLQEGIKREYLKEGKTT